MKHYDYHTALIAKYCSNRECPVCRIYIRVYWLFIHHFPVSQPHLIVSYFMIHLLKKLQPRIKRKISRVLRGVQNSFDYGFRGKRWKTSAWICYKKGPPPSYMLPNVHTSNAQPIRMIPLLYSTALIFCVKSRHLLVFSPVMLPCACIISSTSE